MKIIAETYALSLASCLEFILPEEITLLAGSTDVTDVSSGLISKASRFFFHPEFDFETYGKSLSFLRTSKVMAKKKVISLH